jgi:hypothetical protein
MSGADSGTATDARSLIVGVLSDLRDVFELRQSRPTPGAAEYWIVRDGAPDIIRDAVRDAHGEHLPNNMVFELCAQVWDWIVEHCDYLAQDDPAGVVGALRSDTCAFMCADYLAESSDWCWYSEQARWFAGDPDARDWCETYRRDYLGGCTCEVRGRGDVWEDSGAVDSLIRGGLFVRLRAIASELSDVLAGLIEDRAGELGVTL